MQEPAFVAFSAQTRERIGQSIARHRERRRLLTRAAEHRRRKALSMLGNVFSRNEAAHGMAEHHIGHLATETRLHNAAQGVHISNENLSAIASGHMAQVLHVGNAFSMPHVIVRAHHETGFYKEFREMGVAHDMLRHSVHDLNDAPNIRISQPLRGFRAFWLLGCVRLP